MGRSRARKYTKRRTTENDLPKEQWRDLVILTALLLGAEFRKCVRGYAWECDGVFSNHRWKCARDWLWRRRAMVVRKDGTIYQPDPPMTEALVEIAEI